jgi:hypothetical protein
LNYRPLTARAWLGTCAMLLALLCLAPAAWAQASMTTFTNNCAGCHGNGSGYVNTPSGSALYGKILPLSGSPWLTSASAFRTKLNSAIAPMGGVGGFGTTLSDTELDNIRAYLIEARDALVTSSVSAFPNTTVGNTSGTTRIITITNRRGVGITYSAITPPTHFTVVSESCGTRVVPANDGSCTVTIGFAPQSVGPQSGNLNVSFASNGTDPTPATHTIALSGTGTAPIFSIPSGTMAFSATVTSPTTTSTTITNTGNVNLVLGTLTFGGAQGSDYSLGAGNTCTASASIAPSGSCTLVVQFDPAAQGTRTGSLSITHNASGSPQVITLNGTASPAPAPNITLSAGSLSFPDTQLGSSSPLTLTVGNNGQASLVFSGISVSGAASSNYVTSGTCSTSTPVAVSGSCTVIVTFSPSALGARAASLTLTSNSSSNSTAVIGLSGNGVPVPAPVVSFSAAQIDFGNQTLAGLYQPRTVTLTNTGTANLTFSSLALSGAGFSLVTPTPCTSPLAASAHCDIQVQFAPTTAGANYTGTITLTSNAAGSPHVVNLLGHGTTSAAPVLVWSPLVSSAAFGAVNVGSLSTTQTATLSNQGPGGATLSLANAVGADASHFSVTLSGCSVGGVLYEGDTCQVILQFVPGSAGAKTANVQIASSGSPPTALVMTGTGMGGPTPQMSLSAASLAFGHVRVGAQSVPIQLHLSNSGANALHVSGIDVTGSYSMGSTTCPTLPFDLPAGAECSVAVSFSPTAEGTRTGNLRVTSDASPASVDVPLDGQGDAAPDVSGGGGCSLVEGDSPFDPTLWALVAGAVAVLAHRHRARRRQGPRA